MSISTSNACNKFAISSARLLALVAIGVVSASVGAAPVINSQPQNGVTGSASRTGVPATSYDDFTFANGANDYRCALAWGIQSRR
jgi:hypothetical protein